jgi:hypothetical protein
VTGETYLEAFFRESREELQLEVNHPPRREVTYCSPLETGLSAFTQVFEIHFEREPDFNHKGFSKRFWLLPAELKARILGGKKAKGDLLESLQCVFVVKFYHHT